jgi:hypothetical protein
MGVVTASVTSAFATASSYAASATAQANSFITQMQDSIYTPPQIDVQWTSIAAPSMPAMPAVPSMPSITFNDPGNRPGALSVGAIDITIDDFAGVAPTLAFPTAPTITYGTAPVVPAINDVTVPTAPTLTAPTAPTFLTLGTVAFANVDIHEDWLANLQNVPTLTLMSPTPFSYARGAEYASSLLAGLKAKLAERLAGGSGLTPAVEQAIWDRARDRETKIADGNRNEVMRQSEAFGFALPSGALAAQLREADQNYYDKLSELSRDISVKQADLEQANLKDTIAAGMQLESTLIDYSYRLEQLTFETAKQYADNAIQVYNASVEQFKALLAGYSVYSENYKTLISAELAKIEVYKGQLAGEQLKVEVNQSLVAQYRASIEANMAQVEIYRAQVGAAQTLVSLEQARLGAAGEQIRAYTAQINAETAKVEAYKAGVQGEATKVEAYSTQARAYASLVGAQAEKARVEVARYGTSIQAYAAQWDGYRAAVAAETARMEALGKQSGALLDGYRANAAAVEATANIATKVWEGNIKQYEAGLNITLQTAKINTDSLVATNNARLDASKVGAQVFAQLASSAYGMARASTNLTGGQSMSASYNYSGEATGTVLIDP